MTRAWSMLCVRSLLVALSWCCASRALAFDESLDEPPACDRTESQCDTRWGVVIAAALGLSREASEINPRAAFRVNFPLSDFFEAQTDLVLGGFPGFEQSERSRRHSRFGVGLRAALQLNVGSVYTLGLGTELALALSGPIVGAHVSFLGFRIGPEREFLLSFPQQFWLNAAGSSMFLEQVLRISYLFDF